MAQHMMHYQPSCQSHGVTLVELVCTLAVMLVVLQGGLTLFGDLLPSTRLTSDTNLVVGLLAEARRHALGREPVMVCAANSDCTRFSTSDGLMLVVDRNHNQQRDTDEDILAQIQLHPHTQISWHSFRNRPNLTYHNNGLSYFQNGHLLLCTPKGASKVVLNWIGRAHVEKANLSACST